MSEIRTLKIYKEKEYWEYEIDEKFSKCDIKTNERKNNFINVCICSFCMFILRLPLYLVPVAFVLSDLVLQFFNIYIVRIKYLKNKNNNNPKYLERRKKNLKTIIQKREKQRENETRWFTDSELQQDIRYKEEEIRDIDRKLDRFKREEEERIRKEQEEKYSVSKAYVDVFENKKNSYLEIIEQLKNLKITKEMKDAGITIKNLIKSIEEIIPILEDKQERVDEANATFNIYTVELINIINNVNDMEEVERAQYYEKIKKLIEEFYAHTKRLKERLKKENYMKTNVDISVLMNELTKDKEDKE